MHTVVSILAQQNGLSPQAWILIFITGLVCCLIYFAPTAIAAMRQHHQIGVVIAVNVFLGWTLVGWVVALAFALSAQRLEHSDVAPLAPAPPTDAT